MLDVHPPHSPNHTWKDFFIHIATITVGLLIAVSLEQTVEYFHRLHERHLLEDELHVESEILQRNAEIDIEQDDARIKWRLALRNDVNLLISSHGKADPPVRPFVAPPKGHGVEGTGNMALLNPIWQGAQADGRIALLPEGLKRAYGVVAFRKAEVEGENQKLHEVDEKVTSYVFQFSDLRTPTTQAISRMSEAQLIEYRALLTDDFVQTGNLRTRMVLVSGELNLVLKEEPLDQRALTAADFRVINEARDAHPLDFSKMADEIEAEDAARNKARK